jgi:hypothetical protein
MVLTFSCKIDLGRLLIGLGMEGPHHGFWTAILALQASTTRTTPLL